jgi:hypothetical protein
MSCPVATPCEADDADENGKHGHDPDEEPSARMCHGVVHPATLKGQGQ